MRTKFQEVGKIKIGSRFQKEGLKFSSKNFEIEVFINGFSL